MKGMIFMSVNLKNVIDILEDIEDMTKQETCHISLTEKPCSLFDSKIGGLPYCPKDVQLPTNSEGQQLILLAQINFSQVPKMNIFPQKGILQFFISNDDLYGMNFDNWSEQKDFRIIFYENIDFSILDNDVTYKLNTNEATDFFPPFNNKTLKRNFLWRLPFRKLIFTNL